MVPGDYKSTHNWAPQCRIQGVEFDVHMNISYISYDSRCSPELDVHMVHGNRNHCIYPPFILKPLVAPKLQG